MNKKLKKYKNKTIKLIKKYAKKLLKHIIYIMTN